MCLCGGGTEPLQQGPLGSVLPPLHSMRQCFGLRPRTKPEAHCSAPASPERRLSLTLHQLGEDIVDQCVSVDAPFSSLLSKQSGLHIISSAGRGKVKPLSHGRAHHTRNGRPGGIGQPARLEPGSPDAEEVVQPRGDAVQTLPGNLVQDWKMLPGNDSSSALRGLLLWQTSPR